MKSALIVLAKSRLLLLDVTQESEIAMSVPVRLRLANARLSRHRLRHLSGQDTRAIVMSHVSSEDDVTDSEGDDGDRLIEVRSWKGIDENGQPATFVEERRQVKMIDRGSVGGSEFRPPSEKLAVRSRREV
ncbi:hypothetical protein E8E11_005997 [Didymella keratinophila]|nr:hypothetical protein E8E11_005997 [Didymella keratinophila]